MAKRKRAGVNPRDYKTDQMHPIPTIAGLIVSAYLIWMLGIFPLYMENGYSAIGDVKYRLFHHGTMVLLIGSAAFLPIYGVWRARTEQTGLTGMVRKALRGLSLPDRLVLLYGGCVCLSYLLSDYREFAWKGADGWQMGMETQIFLLLAYFLISRWFTFQREMMYLHLASSGLVFLLGIFHRFRIDPLHVYDGLTLDQMQRFLSTLGQATWYSSYVCTVFALGMFLFYQSKGGTQRFLTGVYSMLAFATLVTQNSDSAFVALVGVFLLLAGYSGGDIKRWRSFFMVASAMLVSFSGIGILQRIFWLRAIPLDELSVFAAQSPLTAAAAVVCVVLWRKLDYIVTERPERGERLCRYLDQGWRILRWLPAAAVVGVCLLIYLNTAGYLTEWIGYRSSIALLNFNAQWGNNRGSSWMLAWDAYGQTPLTNRLFGVGPDCFSAYVYEIPAYQERLQELWGNVRLTNAHNEYLNALVCYGIIGTAAWIAVLAGGIAHFRKLAEKEPVFLGFALCIAGYACHNFFCYQQVCCTPFLFIVLGVGESLRRRGLTNV